MHGRRQLTTKLLRLMKSAQVVVLRNQANSLLWALLLFLLLLLWWVYSTYDPCGGRIITRNLCEQYRQGEAAGSLCYDLCVERSIYLSSCVTHGDKEDFLWRDSVVRVDPRLRQRDYRVLRVHEGTEKAVFQHMVHKFLQTNLGHAGHHDLVNRLMAFCDFNQDGKINLGEAQSLWRLIHMHDFLMIFMFQTSAAFPRLNGTCGTLYAVETPAIPQLYDKNEESFLSNVFSSAYRWQFPSWVRRAKIALGLLEFTLDLYENSDVTFYMCNMAPTQFGYSRDWEVLVTNTQPILSRHMLQRQLENRTCDKNAHCTYSPQCVTRCDRSVSMCSGEAVMPTLYYTCEIVREYLLEDAPLHMQYELQRLLDKCRNMESSPSRGLRDVQHSMLLYSMRMFLWDEIKNLDKL